MLFVNYKAGIENAVSQEDIVYIITKAQIISKAEIDYVFTDRHAIVDYAEFYNFLNDLNKIDWDLFFEEPLKNGYSQYWHDQPFGTNPKWINRKEIRQAEFLVYKSLPWNLVHCVATINDEVSSKVKTILSEYEKETNVLTRRELYY
jgi:hypothetical protein